MTFNVSELLILGLLLILSTIAFIQWINPVYDESVKVHYTTRLLNFFWIIALIFIVYIILLITNELPSFLSFNDTDNTRKTLLSAVGISLSAFIASASVMKSIANANRIEEQKLKIELFDKRRKIIFNIDQLLLDLIEIKRDNSLSEKEQISKIDKVIKKRKEKILIAKYIFEEKEYNIISALLEKLITYDSLKTSNYDLERIADKKNKIINEIPDLIYKKVDDLKSTIQLV